MKKIEKIRKKAEQILKKEIPDNSELRQMDIDKVINELQVYQIELELQNQELLKTHEELQESRSKYIDLFDNAPVGYLSMTGEAKITDANNTACELLVEKKENISGRYFNEYILPDSQDTFYFHIRKVWTEGIKKRDEICLKSTEGKKVFVQIESAKFYERQSAAFQIRSIVTDISDRVSAEEKLKKSEEKHRLISELLSDYIYSGVIDGENWKPDWIIGAFEEITGFSLQEVMNLPKGWFSLILEEDIPVLIENTEYLLKNNPVNSTYRIRTKDGKVKWLHDFAKPIFNFTSGKLDSVIGAVKDITPVKTAEEKLRNSEAQLQSLLNAMVHSYILLDQNYRILKFNRLAGERFHDATNYYMKEGDNFLTLLPEHLLEPFKDNFSKALSGEIITNERLLEFKTGYKSWLETRYMPARSSGGTIFGVVFSLININDRKSWEIEQKAYSDTLKELIATKDKFFSIMAHDLKSPLSGFIGLTEDLSRNFNDMPVDDIKEVSDALYSTSQYLYKLLDNLLEWSRIQSGAVTFEEEEIVLKDVVDSVIQINLLSLSHKKVDIYNRIPKRITAKTDLKALETIFRNLISNALKFTQSGGCITIRAENAGDNMIEISVQDTGIGMPPEIKDKLFRIEKHFSMPGTGDEKGTGLGLILCREFLEKMGGSIRVESEEGSGSIFIFTVPAA